MSDGAPFPESPSPGRSARGFAEAPVVNPATIGAPPGSPAGSPRDIYLAGPLERVALIRRGIPAVAVKQLLAEVPMGQGAGLAALNLPVATINKKVKQQAALSPDETERVLGLARLLGQVQTMVAESGEPAGFDAGAWLARWLTEPLPSLGGTRPADLLDTMEGQGLVSTALAQLQSGAYA